MRIPGPVVACVALLAACSSSDRGAASAEGGTVVIAAPEPDMLFPPLTRSAQGRAVTDNVYEHLAEIGDNLNTVGDGGFSPRLAERWDWARDSMSITFHVNPKARWHDGQPVRAGDVRFSFDLYKDPQIGGDATGLISGIDSVTVRDSLTAVAWYKRRSPSQFYDLVYQVVILPEHLLKGVPRAQLNTSPLARAPVGTGRFRLSRWDAGTRLEIVADTANYRGRAKLDRVIWTPAADNQSAIAQLLSGQADLFENLTPEQIARVDSSTAVRALSYPGLSYNFMGMNLRDPKHKGAPHPIFGDLAVRRALSMAVDRAAMLKNVFGPLGKPAYGPFPKSLATADSTLRLLPFDLARAKTLLDSLGWRAGADGVRSKGGRPLAFSILVPTSSRVRMSYAVLLQEQFRNAGAKVDLQSMDFNAFLGKQYAHDFDAIMGSYNTDPALSGAKQNWGTSGIAKDGANAVSYSSPTFDALLDSAIASFDPQKAQIYASRAYQQVVDDAPAIWLYDLLSVMGIQKRIKPMGLRADGWWTGLADWTIPPAGRIDRDRLGLTPKPQ